MIDAYGQALEAITLAYLLNPYYRSLYDSLEKILEANNLSIAFERMSFPFSIERENEEICQVLFFDEAAIEWMPLALVLAVWEMEPAYREIQAAFDRDGMINTLV